MNARNTLLYDADCGFCLWMVELFLRWDRYNRLRALALQSPAADELLGGMNEQRKMGSSHLVTADGSVYSRGYLMPPLFELLPGGRPFARLTGRFPRATDRLVAWVGHHRSRL